MEMIAKLRKQMGLTVNELGGLMGVTGGAISLYERGERQPPVDMCVRLANLFDVSLDLLIRGKEKDRPTKERSLKEMLEMYGQMTDAELELHAALINASLAERRYRAAQEGNK